MPKAPVEPFHRNAFAQSPYQFGAGQRIAREGHVFKCIQFSPLFGQPHGHARRIAREALDIQIELVASDSAENLLFRETDVA